MAGQNRRPPAAALGRGQTGVHRAERKSRQRQPARRNRWFGMLTDAVEHELAERGDPPDLSLDQILAWADSYHSRTGNWPNWDAGAIPESPGETWLAVEAALALGGRGCKGGSTILQVLAEHWRRPHQPQPDFTVERILGWADAWHERTGRRPITTSGGIPGAEHITWKDVDDALREGRTDRPAGLWLSRLLLLTRGVFRHKDRPPLTEEQILAWADAHYQRTGSWPTHDSGWIAEAPGEAWNRVNEALEQGTRGLPGQSSLPRLLGVMRGARNKADLPALTEEQVLAWADAYHERHGRWPVAVSGPIAEAPGETWLAVQSALQEGLRGLAGGSSIAQLLVKRRGARDRKYPPPFTISQILGWADAFHSRSGQWPIARSGAVAEEPGETWLAIAHALRDGLRGLSGGSSLARLLNEERGVRNIHGLPPLTSPEILRWADAYHARCGTWPKRSSGPIPDSPGDTWLTVCEALYHGHRALPGGSSLARLLAKERGSRNIQSLPPLSVEQILAWADAHHARTGQWPKHKSGTIMEAPGEKWLGVENALRLGLRGLPGGSSLYQLLARERGIGRDALGQLGN